MPKLRDIDLYKIGGSIQISGAIYQGEGKLYLVFFPGEVPTKFVEPITLDLDDQEWKQFIRQTDIMEVEVERKDPDTGEFRKAIMRKSQRQIDQVLTWNVFRRDDYSCRYCGNNKTPLTVDHVICWENGGPTIEENLVACCKKCNRVRGNTLFVDWLQHEYYLERAKHLSAKTLEANRALVRTITTIPLVTHQRSR